MRLHEAVSQKVLFFRVSTIFPFEVRNNFHADNLTLDLRLCSNCGICVPLSSPEQLCQFSLTAINLFKPSGNYMYHLL
jgi:hypothetical protein